MSTPDSLGPIMISGANVALGPVREELVPFYHELRNDLVVQKTTGTSLMPNSMVMTARKMAEGGAIGPDHAPFTVYRIDTWEPIGLVGLRDISHFDRVAEFGITLHRNHLGQGFGTETAKLVLAYGFQMLNLHSVFLTTDGSNIRGQRAYQKAGFREVGRFREHCIVDRERYDLICMDCLASEFVMPEPLRWGPPE
ncbi:MAG: GNAT family protein [Thermomicrobiales bacterium]